MFAGPSLRVEVKDYVDLPFYLCFLMFLQQAQVTYVTKH